MRVLILDDYKLRHEVLATHYIGADITHVWTAAEAIRALYEGPRFDVVSLDHDLAGIKVQRLDETGQEVCRFLALAGPEDRPGKVIIHSWNMAGASRMEAILRSAGYSPVRDPAPCNGVGDE